MRAIDRGAVLEWGPIAALIGAAWLKTSYFNFPPRESLAHDWNGWRFAEAAQAGVASLALLLLLAAPLLLLPPTRRYLALWGLDLLATLLVLANLVHFRFYGDVLSVTAVGAAGQVGMVLASIRELLRPADALLLADLAVGAVLFPAYSRRMRGRATTVRGPARPLARRVALAGVLLLLAIPVRVVAMDRGDTFRYGYFRFFGVRKIGLVNYHLYEAGRQSAARLASAAISEEDRRGALAYLDAWRDTATAPSPLSGTAAGSNVIFLMVESLQSFPIGLRIGGRELTPNLNALAARSMVWENFFGQTWEGTTSDGEFTSLHSLHPLPTGSVPVRYAGSHVFRGLPEVLAERGYATLSAHAYFGDLWRMREMHPNLGFERSVFQEQFRITERVGEALSDGEFFRQALPMVEALPRPFMAYLMTMSTHHPYEVPPHLRTLPLGDLEGTLLGDYLHAVHYFDGALGQLVASLERTGLLDETVLVVYGDHRAELGDEADFARLLRDHAGVAARSGDFDVRLWRESHRVPLLIHLPGDRHAGVRRTTGGHLDITPTVLGLLGIRDHAMAMLGRDLTQGTDAFVVFRNGGWVRGDTACVAPDATIPAKSCSLLSTGARLDAERLQDRWAAAARRLEVSDVVVRADLAGPR